MSKSDLLALAERGVERALELGADEAEVFLSVSMGRDVYSEGQRLKAVAPSSQSAQVRVAKGRRVAAAVATSCNRDVLEELVSRAVELASKVEEDPHWRGLPDPEPPLHSWVGYDEGVATAEIGWLAELVRGMIDEAQRTPGVKVTVASAGISVGRYAMANSRGVSVEERGTRCSIGIYLKAGEGTGGEWASSRSLLRDYYPIVDAAVKQALDASRASKLGETLKAPVLFRAKSFAQLLASLLVPAFSAMSVLEGFSPLANKLGQRVLGALTIVDDGAMSGGLATSFFDGEGVARRRTILVEDGVLKSYLHNTYTARRMGVASTGNASRGAGAVGVGPSNLIVMGGGYSESELEAEAALVADGSLLSVHTVNPVTGNFSVVISNPYAVKGGELTPVKPVTVSGNIYEVAALIKPARRVKDTRTGIYTPDVLIGGLTVSG
ncbi:MAG: metallopeptidase TldD-related protein [Thermofilaceae archaeon]